MITFLFKILRIGRELLRCPHLCIYSGPEHTAECSQRLPVGRETAVGGQEERRGARPRVSLHRYLWASRAHEPSSGRVFRPHLFLLKTKRVRELLVSE